MEFDFGRFGLPNIGNSGNIPKTGKTEKAKNVEAPATDTDMTSKPTSKPTDASALYVAATQKFGFVGSPGAKPISGSNAVAMAELYLRAGIGNFRMPTEEEYARISASTIGAMKDIMTVGTAANAEKAIADFEKYFS